MRKKILLVLLSILLVLVACQQPKSTEKNEKVTDFETKNAEELLNDKKESNQATENKYVDKSSENKNELDSVQNTESKEPVKKEEPEKVVKEPIKKEESKQTVKEPVKKEEPKQTVKKEEPKQTVKKPVKKEEPKQIVKEPVKKEEPKQTVKEPVKAQDNYTTKIITQKEKIPFKTINEKTNKLAKGKTQIKTSGVNGTKEISIKVYYKNGIEYKRETINSTTIQKPVNKVVLIGTYIEPKKDVYTDKTTATIKTIPYETIRKETNTLTKGQTKIQTKGVIGSKTIYTKIYYKNGVEYKKEVISSTITQKPVNEVILVGTKVTSSGTGFNLGTERSILINKINNLRKSSGLGSVKFDSELNSLAQARANEMSKARIKGHTRPNGSPWHTIAGSDQRTNSGLFLNSENIAYPLASVRPGAGAYTDWYNSSGHKSNLKLAATTHIGIGMQSVNYNGWDYTIVVYLGGQ